MKKIYVDFDNVLVNFVDVWVSQINSTFNKNILIEDIKEFNSPLLRDDRFHSLYKNNNIYEHTSAFNGAIDFMSELKKLSDVIIITASPESTQKHKSEYIKELFGDIEVIHTLEPKYLFTQDGILIDDRAETIVEHIDNNNTLGIIYNHHDVYKYNNDFELNENLQYCITYDECLNLIKEYL